MFPAEVERRCRIYFLLPNSVHDLLQAESSESELHRSRRRNSAYLPVSGIDMGEVYSSAVVHLKRV